MAVIMTQELADKLIAYYEKFKEDFKDETNLNTLKIKAFKHKTDYGIVLCAVFIFKAEEKEIFKCDWINSRRKEWADGYWSLTPTEAITISQFWAAIQLRIDILKQFPN